MQKKPIIQGIAIILLLLLWKLGAMLMRNELLVPTPEQTFIKICHLFISPHFYQALGFTVLRGLAGFALSFALAVIIGLLAGLNQTLYAFFNPVILTIRSTPVISFILLALIWFGPDNVPVFIAMLTMFPLICTGFISGIRNVNNEYVEMAEIYRIPKARIIREVYIPSLLPFLFNGVSNAMGFGWRAIIIGEVLSQPVFGIGTEMQKAQAFLMVPDLIAWTIVAIILGSVFEWMVKRIEGKVVRWK